MKRAIFFGLNYVGTDSELPDCLKDANDLAAEFGRWNKDWSVHATATVDEFLGLLDGLIAKQKSRDTLLICFSGHGTQFFNRSEADLYDEALVFWTPESGFEILLDDHLRDFLKDVPGTVFTYFDSCFSGGMSRAARLPLVGSGRKFIPFDEDRMTIIRPIPKRKKKAIAKPGPRYRLYACQENEFAISTGTNGLFTQGVIAACSLGWRTLSKIFPVAVRHCQPQQTPLMEIERGSFSKNLFK